MTNRGMMKQAVLMGKGGPWKIREVKIPKAKPNQLLVKVKVATVCKQTDLNTIRALHPPHDHQVKGMLPHHFRIWDNRIPDDLSNVYPVRSYPNEPFPTTMGHEVAGEVVEVGEYNVESEIESLHKRAGFGAGKFKIGDRVTGMLVAGAFGEYVTLNRDLAIKLHDNMDYEEGSLVEPVYIVYNVVRQVVWLGDTIAILGQGALGLIATQIAKATGAERIIISEPVEEKRELAKEFGADITIDPTQKNVVHEIESLTDGIGVDTAIEAAGVPDTIKILPYIMKSGGRIGQIGACCNPVKVDWGYIHFKGLQVTSQGFAMDHGKRREVLQRGLNLIASGKVKVKPLITHHYSLDNIQEAFKLLEKDEKSIKLVIVP